MQWPRPRFTVWRMMIAVAVLAIVLGVSLEAIRLIRRRDEFLKRAETHARWEQSYLNMVRLTRKSTEFSESSTGQQAAHERAEEARFAGYAAHHTALKQKYLRAAEQPWLSIEPDPPPPDPRRQGRYWAEQGDYRRALAACERFARDDPQNYGALNELAWSLATCPEARFRDGKRAIELAARACEISLRQTGDLDPACLDTLAAAHAESGDFQTAIEVQRKAIGLLSPGGPTAKVYRERLDGYKANTPYREMLQSMEDRG